MLNDFTGVRERHAYRRQYDDTASFTFYVDVNYDTIFLIENWINFIVNQDNSDRSIKNSNYSYRVNFPNEYKSRIFIRKFERDYAGRNLEYSFFDAYPLSINSMPVNYDESQVLQCTVNFCFSRYTINAPDGYTKPPSAPSPESPTPENASKILDAQPFEFKSSNITDEYYNNFGDNEQNATNSSDFFDGSNNAFGEGVA